MVESKKRVKEYELKEKAQLDYILADAIGRSISRIYSSSAKLPDISQLYPTLFNEEEVEEEVANRKMELSAIRFKQFADSFNARFKEGNQNE